MFPSPPLLHAALSSLSGVTAVRLAVLALSTSGWLTLLVSPFNNIRKFTYTLPLALLTALYTLLLFTGGHGHAGGGHAAEAAQHQTATPWERIALTLSSPYSLLLEGDLLLLTLVCMGQLWIGAWMTSDFYTNYTCGYNVVPSADGQFSSYQSWSRGRLTFSALLATTAVAGPLGLLLYGSCRATMWAATRSVTPINPWMPEQLTSLRRARVIPPLLDFKPIRFDDTLSTPLRQLYRLCIGAMGLCMLVGVLLALCLLVLACLRRKWRTATRDGRLLTRHFWHLSARWLLGLEQPTSELPKALQFPTVLFPPFMRQACADINWQLLLVPPERRGLVWLLRFRLQQVAIYIEHSLKCGDPEPFWHDLMQDFHDTHKRREEAGAEQNGSKQQKQQQPSRQRAGEAQTKSAAPPSLASPVTRIGQAKLNFFVYGDGIGVGDHELVRRYLHPPADKPEEAVRKGPYSICWSVSPSQHYYARTPLLLMPSRVGGEVNYDMALGRHVIHSWLSHFQHNLADTDTNYELQAQLWRIVPRRTVRPNQQQVYHAVGEAMFFLATGGMLRRDERDAWLHCISNPCSFFPSWMNFLLAGYYGERMNVAAWDTLRSAFARYSHSRSMLAAFETGARGYPCSALKPDERAPNALSREEVLRLIAFVFGIAGAIAPSRLLEVLIDRLWTLQPGETRPQQWCREFHKNPRDFILETMRLSHSIPSSTIIATPQIRADVYGATGVYIPDDTPIHLSQVNPNMDATRFPDPTRFDPGRGDQLKYVIYFNGLDGEINEKDVADRPPRYCPGYFFSMKLLEFLARRFAPVVLSEEMSQPVLPTASTDTVGSTQAEVAAAQTQQELQAQPVPASSPLSIDVANKYLDVTRITLNAESPKSARLASEETRSDALEGWPTTRDPWAGKAHSQPPTPDCTEASSPVTPADSGVENPAVRRAISAPELELQVEEVLVPRSTRPPVLGCSSALVSSAMATADAAGKAAGETSLTPSMKRRYVVTMLRARVEPAVPEIPASLVYDRYRTAALASSSSDYFFSLDLYTHLMYALMGGIMDGWNANPPRGVDMLPASNLPCQDLRFLRTGIGRFLATWDEDAPEAVKLSNRLVVWLIARDWWALKDLPKRFSSIDHAISWRLERFPQLPPPNVVYDSMTSDAATSRLAFFGLACHYTKRLAGRGAAQWQVNNRGLDEGSAEMLNPNLLLTPGHNSLAPDRAVYVNDQTALSMFGVREQYERYGAALYLDEHRQPVGIYWCHAQQMVLPGQGLWEHAKNVWRSTAFASVTIRDHLLQCHMIEANALTTASRQFLDAESPLRWFVKPFTYNTVTVNHQAADALINQLGLVHRIWAFTYTEYTKVSDFVLKNYRYKTLPHYVHESMRGEPSSQFPIQHDMPLFWQCVKRYVKRFFDIQSAHNTPHAHSTAWYIRPVRFVYPLTARCVRWLTTGSSQVWQSGQVELRGERRAQGGQAQAKWARAAGARTPR